MDTKPKDPVGTRGERQLVTVRIPTWWTLAELIGGLIAGLLLARSPLLDPVLTVSAPVGALWLRALQVTIVPLVAGLLVVGISQMAHPPRRGGCWAGCSRSCCSRG